MLSLILTTQAFKTYSWFSCGGDVCTCMWTQRSISDAVSRVSYTLRFFGRQIFKWNYNWLGRLRWLARVPQESVCLCLPATSITEVCTTAMPHFLTRVLGIEFRCALFQLSNLSPVTKALIWFCSSCFGKPSVLWAVYIHTGKVQTVS